MLFITFPEYNFLGLKMQMASATVSCEQQHFHGCSKSDISSFLLVNEDIFQHAHNMTSFALCLRVDNNNNK